jgi:hypothetical protein
MPTAAPWVAGGSHLDWLLDPELLDGRTRRIRKAAARTACFDSPGDRVPGVFFSNRLWETVRAAALGTSGAPFATTDLSVSRGHEEQPLLGWPLFYEELPADIVASIIARRDRHASEGIQRILSSVDDPDALADAIKALKEIATNTTFVHAAYYTAPAVIKLVAQWIAVRQ